jgi:uncharacterized SAM-binding protein YcdF (DUF218 family)
MAGKLIYSSSRPKYKSFYMRYGRAVFIAILLLCIVGVYWAARYSAFLLVQNDTFAHVPYVLVLDGQGPDMERSDYALDLLAQGKADTIIISGKRIFKTGNAADYYRSQMLTQGDFDGGRLLVLPHDDESTIEEARTAIPYLLARKADTVLLVTASMAAARVRSIFEALTPEGQIVYLSTNMEYADFFDPKHWMNFREGQKTWLLEMLKRVFTVYELWGAQVVQPVAGKDYFLGTSAGHKSAGIVTSEVPKASPEDALLEAVDVLPDSLNAIDSLLQHGATDSVQNSQEHLEDSLDQKDSAKAGSNSNN